MAYRAVYDENGSIVGVEPCPDPPAPQLTPLEIVTLFTPTELLAIEQSTSLLIVAARTQLFAATVPIALDDERFVGSVSAMVALGIVTQERADRILTNLPPST